MLPKLVQIYDCCLLLFFHVGTNDAAGGNLESIKTACRALEATVSDVGAQRCGSPALVLNLARKGRAKDAAHQGLVMELLVATEVGFL